MCFAVHILVIDHFGATCDGVKLSCVQFLFAALWSAVCIPFFEHVDAAALLSCALPLLYVGVFSCGVGSVSYAHLDVYKRQGICGSMPRISPMIACKMASSPVLPKP